MVRFDPGGWYKIQGRGAVSGRRCSPPIAQRGQQKNGAGEFVPTGPEVRLLASLQILLQALVDHPPHPGQVGCAVLGVGQDINDGVHDEPINLAALRRDLEVHEAGTTLRGACDHSSNLSSETMRQNLAAQVRP